MMILAPSVIGFQKPRRIKRTVEHQRHTCPGSDLSNRLNIHDIMPGLPMTSPKISFVFGLMAA